MKKIFQMASEVGGCGTAISGAGPSILTFVNQHLNPHDVVRTLSENLEDKKIRAQLKVLGIARQGAIVEQI
jgi:homoserine kinase